MQWQVRLADNFEPELDELPEIVQDELLARAKLLFAKREMNMARTLTDKLISLPADRREYIEARAADLIDQELTLRELRKALDMTQTTLAEQLKVGQETVSRLERRTDMLLSTLDDYVQALGGRLELNVEFPGHKKIRLKSLHEPKSDSGEAA